MTAVRFSDALGAQRRYARSVTADGVVITAPFLRSARRSGYLSTATALHELIDNSLEAGAKNVHVVFGFGTSSSKPSALAVVDDGHGMGPSMLRLALMWGGTHREGSREGFGRFGFGLPSASISQGRSVAVYSRTPSGRLYAVEMRLERSASSVEPPLSEPRPDRLPGWLAEYCRRMRLSLTTDGGHGTAVVINSLDALSWRTAVALERNLERSIGITYRNFLRHRRVYVQGSRVMPIDPLFLDPAAKYYDLDRERAEPVPWSDVLIDRPDGGTYPPVRVRAAYFPPTFPRVDKAREAAGLNANARFGVMRENNGIIVMRMGRQIDVVASGLWTQFQHNDRYWAVELDFPAELDEELSVTVNKQRVTLSARIVEGLRDCEVPKLIDTLRQRYKRDRELLPRTPVEFSPDVPVPGASYVPSVYTTGSGGTWTWNPAFPAADAWQALVGRDPGGAAALSLLVGALVDAELATDRAGREFYVREREVWSKRLLRELRGR